MSPIPALPSTKLLPTTCDTQELPDFYNGKNGAASNYQIPKKLLRSSKSLPDLIIHSVKKENITSDSEFIDLVLSRTIGKGEPDVVSEFFYLVDNDYKAVIEYSPQMFHKKGFILVNFNKDNVNDFEFDLLKIKNKDKLIKYLSKSKYPNNESLINTLNQPDFRIKYIKCFYTFLIVHYNVNINKG